MTTTTTQQVLTTDQNTARQVTWTIEHISEPVANAKPGQFTHLLGVRRQNGRALYMMWAEIDPTTNQVIRNSQPWRAGW